MPEIRLHLGAAGRDCDLFVDGERWVDVQAVTIHAEVGRRTKVHVTQAIRPSGGVAEGTVDEIEV